MLIYRPQDIPVKSINMQFSRFLAAAGAFAVASAKVILTNSAYQGITVGVSFTITWSDATGPVTLKLRSKGNTADFMPIACM
jgi:hypothetical protein